MKKATMQLQKPKASITISQDLSDVESDSNHSTAESSSSHASKRSASSSDSEMDYVQPNKQKKSKEKVPVANAIKDILGKKLNENDASRPILAGAKLIEKQLDKEKKDYKVARALALERKQRSAAARVKPNITPEEIEYERQLKKAATRGVVKLFNAIRQAQHQDEEPKQRVTPKPVVPTSDKAAWSVFHDDFATNPATYESEEGSEEGSEQEGSEPESES